MSSQLINRFASGPGAKKFMHIFYGKKTRCEAEYLSLVGSVWTVRIGVWDTYLTWAQRNFYQHRMG